MAGEAALFRTEGLEFRYGTRPVLADLSLELGVGRFHGLLGPNGCGKTTLVDLLAGLKLPQAGRITFQGRDLAARSRRALAREIALVPQDFSVNFAFTARETIMMGRYPHMPRFTPPSAADHRTVESVMDQTDTRRLAEQPVTSLSGGERQRVVFARALAQSTPVLFLDEATSNLDIRHALDLLNLTTERVRRQGHTVLAVFQDINLAAMYCDELLFLKDGRLAAQGTPAEVLTAETLAAVFGVSARVSRDPDGGTLQVSYRR
jgi:iron complex transport system ATP-binding protein